VELSNSLSSYDDEEKLKSLNLIVPNWTMGELTLEQLDSVVGAVASGVGIAGCHAGLCDAFRNSPDWQFMVGGQLVAHVGAAGVSGHGTEFKIHIKDKENIITKGIEDFKTYDEQYYCHVDSAIKVLATTDVPPVDGDLKSEGKATINFDYSFGDWNFHKDAFYNGPHVDNGPVEIPVVWIKYWGRGRVFYNSLGHDAKRANSEPSLTITKRGFLWAAK
jgi:uncharacterized protein